MEKNYKTGGVFLKRPELASLGQKTIKGSTVSTVSIDFEEDRIKKEKR